MENRNSPTSFMVVIRLSRALFQMSCRCFGFMITVGHFIPQAAKVRENPMVKTDFTGVGRATMISTSSGIWALVLTVPKRNAAFMTSPIRAAKVVKVPRMSRDLPGTHRGGMMKLKSFTPGNAACSGMLPTSLGRRGDRRLHWQSRLGGTHQRQIRRLSICPNLLSAIHNRYRPG